MADTFTKDVLGIVPGVMALGLVGNTIGMSLRQYPKNYRTSRPANPKPFVRGAVTALVGIPLIGATASAINRL